VLERRLGAARRRGAPLTVDGGGAGAGGRSPAGMAAGRWSLRPGRLAASGPAECRAGEAEHGGGRGGRARGVGGRARQ
jgi:hypothetical protein